MSTHHAAHSGHDQVTLGEKVDQPGWAPTAKLRAVGATGVATAVLLYAASRAGLVLPEQVAEAIVLVGGWLGGYIKRDKAVSAVVTRVQAALAPLLGTPAGAALEAQLEADVAALTGGGAGRVVPMLGTATQSAAELGIVPAEPVVLPAETVQAATEAVRGPEV